MSDDHGGRSDRYEAVLDKLTELDEQQWKQYEAALEQYLETSIAFDQQERDELQEQIFNGDHTVSDMDKFRTLLDKQDSSTTLSILYNQLTDSADPATFATELTSYHDALGTADAHKIQNSYEQAVIEAHSFAQEYIDTDC